MTRTLRVGIPALGQRRIRRAADSAFSARFGTRGDAGPPERERKLDPPDSPDKALPLREIAGARASGDSLVICFAGRGPRASDEAYGQWRRIVVTGLAAADARHFADVVQRAKRA